MSVRLTVTVSDALAAEIEKKRGVYSPQEFIVQATMETCYGSPVEAELRRQIDQLHETIRQLGARPAPPEPVVTPAATPAPTTAPAIEKMGW